MLTRRAALEIAKLFRFFDATCRHDLATQRIISERDYVSNLATHIRYPHGSLFSNRLDPYGRSLNTIQLKHSPRFVSVTSAPNIEQKYGCDGIIVFSFDLGKLGTFHRVGMYEAKWPRLHEHSGAILTGWDDIGWRPTSRKRTPPPPKVYKSRFTNELLLQRQLAHAGVVVWEQFFCQLAVPVQNAEFRKYGSTCVMHDDALKYLFSNLPLWPSPPIPAPKRGSKYAGLRAWNGTDLSLLLQGDSISFGYLIYLMLRPNRCGRYLQAINNQLTVPFPRSRPANLPVIDVEEQPAERQRPSNNVPPGLITIPVFTTDAAAADYPFAITRFMHENGINSYLHITIDAGFIPETELALYLQTVVAENGL